MTMVDEKRFGSSFIQFVGTKATGGLRFGPGLAAQTGVEAAKLAEGKALVVVGRTLHRLKLDEPILRSLEEAGFSYDLFLDVEPEPSMETMEKAADMAKNGYACVIGAGGGSVLDTAKLAALAGASGKTAEEIFAAGGAVGQSLPTILLPSTSGTGSEVSPYIVASRGGKKVFVGSAGIYASLAIVDPLLTVSMPPRTTAFSGLDALSHGIEGAMGKPNPYTLAMAEGCAKLVFRYLPRAVENGQDLEARYYMSYASVLGMLAYTQGGGLYAHSMSYVLTERCGLPHGGGCGLALPHTVDFCREQIPEVMEILHDVTGDDGPQALQMLLHRVGAPTTLRELGIREEELDALAELLLVEYPRPNNPRILSTEDARRLLRDMYGGVGIR